MNKALLIALLIIPFTLGAQTAPAPSGTEKVMADLGAFSAMSPRREGSENEKRVLSRIKDRLSEMAVPFEETNFNHLVEGHSFSQSIIADLGGTGDDSLFIAASLDQDETEIERGSGSLNLALLLAIADKYAKNPSHIKVKLLFLGAEKGTGDHYPMGSRQFLENYYTRGKTAVLYLDFDFLPKRIQLHAESGGQISPIWMIQTVSQNLQNADLNFLIHGNHPQIFRFNLPQRQTIINPFFEKNIPAILFESGKEAGKESNLGKWIPSFLIFINSFIGEVNSGIPTTWDKHYLFFQIQSNFLILSQGNYILIFITVSALLLLLIFVFPRTLKEHSRDVIKSLWQLPMIFILLFTFLWVSTALANLILTERHFESLWSFVPLAFLSFKLLVGIFAFYLTFYLIRRMPLSRWSGFYAYSAVFVLILAVFVSLALDLAFSFYFLWALIFAMVFASVKNKLLKIVSLFIAPFWFVKAAIDLLFTQPDLTISQAAVLSPMAGNLVVTLLLLPFFLMISSFHFISHQRPERNERLYSILLAVLWAASSLALMFFLVNFNPFDQVKKAPLSIEETIDLDQEKRTVTYSSPIPTDPLSFTLDRSLVKVQSGERQKTITLPMPENILKSQIKGKAFLDRVLWSADFESVGQPLTLDLNLESPTGLVIYQCNFPFEINKEGNYAKIFIGRYPPQKIHLELTLDRKMSTKLRLKYHYTTYPFAFLMQEPLFRGEVQLNLLQSFDLYLAPPKE